MSYSIFICIRISPSLRKLFCCISLWLVFPIFSVDFIINANFHLTNHCFTLLYSFNIKWHWFSPHTSFILLLIILRSLHLSLLGYLHIKMRIYVQELLLSALLLGSLHQVHAIITVHLLSFPTAFCTDTSV